MCPDQRSMRWPYNVSQWQEIPKTGHARNQRDEAPLLHDTRCFVLAKIAVSEFRDRYRRPPAAALTSA
jgi:hypothetical protein